MKTEGWRGKGNNVPQWKLQARRAKTVGVNQGFSMGGLPRKVGRTVVSLPKLKCLEGKP
jgi:hypothetical protein